MHWSIGLQTRSPYLLALYLRHALHLTPWSHQTHMDSSTQPLSGATCHLHQRWSRIFWSWRHPWFPSYPKSTPISDQMERLSWYWQFLGTFLTYHSSRPCQRTLSLKSHETQFFTWLNPHSHLHPTLQQTSLEPPISLRLNLPFFHYIPPIFLCFLYGSHVFLQLIFRLFVVFGYTCFQAFCKHRIVSTEFKGKRFKGLHLWTEGYCHGFTGSGFIALKARSSHGSRLLSRDLNILILTSFTWCCHGITKFLSNQLN